MKIYLGVSSYFWRDFYFSRGLVKFEIQELRAQELAGDMLLKCPNVTGQVS